jgi:hypothetical protein
MARLKVEFAEAGTDPTRATNHVKHNVGLWATVKENWMLFAGLLIFLLLAPKILGIQLFNGNADTAAVTPTATITPVSWEVDPYVSWCSIGNTLVPPGVHNVGGLEKDCVNGAWD